MKTIYLLTFCLVAVISQVNLNSPQSRSGNPNIRVVGSTAGVNPCGNGSDTELRAARVVSASATFWHGAVNATNISLSFGNLNTFWTLSIVSYDNYTGVIRPNTTVLPLPVARPPVILLGSASVNMTTNGSIGNYLLKEYRWPLEAAAACRPNFYGCALRVAVTNPFGNDTYVSCADIRVYSHSFDASLVFTVKMNDGVVPPNPATMLGRIRNAYSTKGVTATNSRIVPDGDAFTLRSDNSFTFTLIVSDIPNFTSDSVVATVAADASTTLVNTLGVATVALGNPPAEDSGNGGATAAIVIIILLILLITGGLVCVKFKKPATWKSWCDAISNCWASCKPAKGTNI